jgi:NADH-quinone oxidoreductase subunit G
MRSQGINHVDHRLHQIDFADQDSAKLAPISAIPYADIEKQQAILLVGTHLNHEQPLANVRVRKAYLNGAKIMAINPIDYDLHYTIAEKMIDVHKIYLNILVPWLKYLHRFQAINCRKN